MFGGLRFGVLGLGSGICDSEIKMQGLGLAGRELERVKREGFRMEGFRIGWFRRDGFSVISCNVLSMRFKTSTPPQSYQVLFYYH